MNIEETTTNGSNALQDYQKQLNILLKGLKFCEPIPGKLIIRLNEKLCEKAYTYSDEN